MSAAGRHLTVRNPDGIHCRPASLIVRAAVRHVGLATIEANGGHADLRSVMDILSLALMAGDTARLHVEGDDAEARADELKELFEAEYNFRDGGAE